MRGVLFGTFFGGVRMTDELVARAVKVIQRLRGDLEITSGATDRLARKSIISSDAYRKCTERLTGEVQALDFAIAALKRDQAYAHLQAIVRADYAFMHVMSTTAAESEEWRAEHGYESDEPYEAFLRARIAASEFLEAQSNANGEDARIWTASRERDQGDLERHLEEIARNAK